MRRGLVLTCLWVVGVTASVALAFGAVGSVASQVAPPGVARLSARGVDRALGTTVSSPHPTTAGKPPGSSAPPVSGRGSTTTAKRPGPGSTGTVAPPPTSGGSVTSTPTSSATSTPPTTGSPPPTAAPPTTGPHSTATTSVGGTIWTRCSGANHIDFVAAVPRGGYERTRDVENPVGIVQWFDNGNHVSKISAECSNGVVHAEVEEEREGADYAPPTENELTGYSST